MYKDSELIRFDTLNNNRQVKHLLDLVSLLGRLFVAALQQNKPHRVGQVLDGKVNNGVLLKAIVTVFEEAASIISAPTVSLILHCLSYVLGDPVCSMYHIRRDCSHMKYTAEVTLPPSSVVGC